MNQLLKRPIIEDLLKNAFKKPLTTVVAGAGYGKTQAVLSALKSTDCKPVWIHLSTLDNAVENFWEQFAYEFGTYSQSLKQDLLSLGYPESVSVYNRFLHLLKKNLTEDHYILIFDDLHLISNKSILSFFELFISARIQNFSIVLLSRTTPDLSLSNFLSKGLLERITEEELRFTIDEMKMYFREQDFNLDEELFSNIYSYTNGWIFAIYLVGLAVSKGHISNQNPLLAAKVDIFNLIEKEIFAVASIPLQEFLIKIALLEVIPSGLLEELAQHNTALIDEMTQISLFIRYDSLSDSYIIHHLFHEFLYKKKGDLTEGAIKEIHLAAAHWYKKNNRKFEALGHYKECDLYDEIFDIILSIDLVPREVADTLIALIDQAPDEILETRPLIQIARLIYMLNNNRIEEAQQELFSLREKLEALPRTEENQTLLGEVYIALGFIKIIHIDYEFIDLFKRADKCLPGGSKLVYQKFIIADGYNICSIKDPSPGSLKRQCDALFTVGPYISKVLNGCAYGIEYLNAAEASLYQAKFKDVEKYAYEAIYRSKQYQQFGIEFMATLALIRVWTAKGKYTNIHQILEDMEITLESIRHANSIHLSDVIKGWFYLKIGQNDKVASWLSGKDETWEAAPVILGREFLVRSDYLMSENQYYKLLAFMEQTDQMYEARGILFARIQNAITRAMIYHDMENHQDSMYWLHKAYDLSYPNKLIMQFIEYGKKMRTLINVAKRNKECTIPQEWLDNIYTKSSTYAKQLAQVVSDYNAAHATKDILQSTLSEREMEVLIYLCRGLTREEIADSCYLSRPYVNSLLRSIYDKLGAANAVDAVRIAKEKCLI